MSRFQLATWAVVIVLNAAASGLAQAPAAKPAPSLGDTIQEYEQLIQRQPESLQLKRTRYLLGKAYQSIGSYREAAVQYETLAKQFPWEFAADSADSPWALAQAALKHGWRDAKDYGRGEVSVNLPYRVPALG